MATATQYTATLLLILVLLSACSRSEPVADVSTPLVSDSAGVEVVTNRGLAAVLTAVELFSIRGIGGDSTGQFYQVRGMAFVPHDSSVWVVDANPSVRHFDQRGRYLGSVGGMGAGPGEAGGWADVWAGEDRVMAFGFPSFLLLFAAEGPFIESRRARSGGRVSMMPLGFGRGRWIFRLHHISTPTADRTPARRLVTVAAAEDLSSELDSIGSFDGEIRSGPAAGPYFAGNPSFGVDGAGRIWTSDPLEFRITVHNGESGIIERVVVRDVAPREFDAQWKGEIEREVRRVLEDEGAGRPVPQSRIDEMVATVFPPETPEHLPFIERILVAWDGTLWVLRGDRHPDPGMRAVAHLFGWVRHEWRPEWRAAPVVDLFWPSGEYRGTLHLPRGFVPMAVGPHAVFGVMYGSLGVESVVAFGIEGE